MYTEQERSEKCRERVKKNLLFLDYLCNLIEGREEIKMVLEIVKRGDVFFCFLFPVKMPLSMSLQAG